MCIALQVTRSQAHWTSCIQTALEEDHTSAEMTLTLMSFSTLTISTSSPGRSSVLMCSVLNADSSLCWMLMTVSTERLQRRQPWSVQ